MRSRAAEASNSEPRARQWRIRWWSISIILAGVLLLMVPIFTTLISRTTRLRLSRAARRIVRDPGHEVRVDSSLKVRSVVATGPLRVDSSNPRYFTDGSGKAILLVGDHTWYTLQDCGSSDPPPAFNYTAFLVFLQANYVNFFRMFAWEQVKWSAGSTTPYYYYPSVFERLGPGAALDGKPRFDLTKFNQDYFDRLRARVTEAGNRGIYVSIQLFQGFSVADKSSQTRSHRSPWPGHPLNKSNNINGINGDPNGDGQGYEIQSLAIPAVTAIQETYVRRVIDTVNDLDNVLFEIVNESDGFHDSVPWQNHMVDFIHSYEAIKPKQHPVGFTVPFPYGNNADLFASNADWVSPNSDGGYYDNPPTAEGRKVVITDTDHLCYPWGDRSWVWRSFTRGYNPAFMDPYDCTADWSPSGRSGCDPNDPEWVSLRKNLGYVLGYANRLNLVAMKPHGELASTGYCLANPAAADAEYLVYLPEGRTASTRLRRFDINRNIDLYLPADSVVEVDLSASPGRLSVEWFNPSTGDTLNGGSIIGGTRQTFRAPFRHDAALYVHAEKSAALPHNQFSHLN
jgi:hypothetical protein